MDGARGKVEAVGDFFQTQGNGQAFAQEVADARDHGAVATIERGDLARRTVKKAFQVGFVAAHRQFQQIGIETGDQGAGAAGDSRGKAGIFGKNQVVIRRMLRPPIGEEHAVERQATRDQPAGQAVQQAQQPFEGKNPPGIVGGGRQAAGFGDDQLGLAMLAADADLQVGQDQAQETAHACQRLA